MAANRVARAAGVIIGLGALSPAAVYLLRVAEPLGAAAFIVLGVAQLLALGVVAWALRSASRGALLGVAAAAPWLFYLAPDGGPWAYLVATPELVLLAAVGWYGRRREVRKEVAWLGAVVPTLALAYAIVAPLVRAN